jgi:acyl carrier protein
MTTEEALSWIADILDEPIENMRPDMPRSEIKGWDSLGILSLMARFDEDLSILLSEPEVQQFRNIGDILQSLRKHGRLTEETTHVLEDAELPLQEYLR